MAAILLALMGLAIDDPVVAAKGKTFIVHGLPGAKALELARVEPPPPSFVLHTALPSGKTRVLVRSGTTIGIPIPMAIDRWPITQKRIAGVAADSERLYVLVWSASWKHEDYAGKGLVVGKPPESDLYVLHVFWLGDGAEVGSTAFTKGKRPKAPPAERLEKGPLEVKDGTATAFGETFRWRGKKQAE